jgi:hypothetical protein
VKGLQNIDTIVFSLWYMYDYSSEASNEELALLADMFRPVRSSAYHGGTLAFALGLTRTLLIRNPARTVGTIRA